MTSQRRTCREVHLVCAGDPGSVALLDERPPQTTTSADAGFVPEALAFDAAVVADRVVGVGGRRASHGSTSVGFHQERAHHLVLLPYSRPTEYQVPGAHVVGVEPSLELPAVAEVEDADHAGADRNVWTRRSHLAQRAYVH